MALPEASPRTPSRAQLLERLTDALDWLNARVEPVEVDGEIPVNGEESPSRAITIRWQTVSGYVPPGDRIGRESTSFPPRAANTETVRVYYVTVPCERFQAFDRGERWFDTIDAALADAAADVIEAARKREEYAHRRVHAAVSVTAKVERLLGGDDDGEDRFRRSGEAR